MTIVMGMDQHRAQITTEWVDTTTGEIGRARVAPADRERVRRFLARFAGEELEVALEATTGWRFVVEELRAVGAAVHLGEPAGTSALRGHRRRPQSDRMDATHLRQLSMIGRLPESWIPPDHQDKRQRPESAAGCHEHELVVAPRPDARCSALSGASNETMPRAPDGCGSRDVRFWH